jgi:hypothetical protein
MGTMDMGAIHGKYWVMEDDTRTSFAALSMFTYGNHFWD